MRVNTRSGAEWHSTIEGDLAANDHCHAVFTDIIDEQGRFGVFFKLTTKDDGREK